MAYDPNDPEDKKIVDDAVAAALQAQQEEHESEVERLNKKNRDVLAKLAKAREGNENAGEIERLETELSGVQHELSETKRNLTRTEKELQKANEARDAAIKERDTAVSERNGEFIENRLTSALSEVKVASHHTDAVKALLMAKNKVTVEGEGDERQVLVNGKPLGDFVKEYAASDAGKHYIVAPGNAGGGANGANGGGSPGGLKKLEEYSEAERIDMARNRPEEWKQVQAAAGINQDNPAIIQ